MLLGLLYCLHPELLLLESVFGLAVILLPNLISYPSSKQYCGLTYVTDNTAVFIFISNMYMLVLPVLLLI